MHFNFLDESIAALLSPTVLNPWQLSFMRGTQIVFEIKDPTTYTMFLLSLSNTALYCFGLSDNLRIAVSQFMDHLMTGEISLNVQLFKNALTVAKQCELFFKNLIPNMTDLYMTQLLSAVNNNHVFIQSQAKLHFALVEIE